MPKLKDDETLRDIVEEWDEWQEGEISEGKQHCPICESLEYETLFILDHGEIVACSDCKVNNENQ